MASRQAARAPREEPSETRSIRLAATLELDQRAATEKFGIIGRSEAGKTYLAGKLVEGLHGIGCQVIVFDPVGTWWGVTLAANGTDPGLPFVIFGGRRGQLPLTAENGRQVARLVIERNLSVVLDLTGLRKRPRPGRGAELESELQRFVADFEEEVLEASERAPKPRMALYDEAHKLLPQVLKAGGNRMLDAGEDLVRTGRNYGWGCVLMSQRPQSIAKEVLSQVGTFFVGQLTEAPARARLGEWIVEKHAHVKRELDELAHLQRGEFFCWSPQWLRKFEKFRVLPKWTFDSSRTPELGELGLAQAQTRSSISESELAGLREALMATAEPPPVRRASGASADVERERKGRRDAEERAERAERRAAELERGLRELQTLAQGLLEAAVPSPKLPDEQDQGAPEARPMAKLPRPKRVATVAEADGRGARGAAGVARGAVSLAASETSETTTGPAGPVDRCQRAIMTVLIQQGKALSMQRLGMMAVYAPTSGGFKNAVSKLRKRGWLEGRGDVSATPSGVHEFVAEFGDVPKLPRGAKLFEFWLQHRRVDKCGRAVLTALRKHGGGPVAPAELAQMTEPPYAASSGGYKNTLSKLRTLGLLEGRGQIMLAEHLR